MPELISSREASFWGISAYDLVMMPVVNGVAKSTVTVSADS